jgi:small conductance mechanosensitive channel
METLDLLKSTLEGFANQLISFLPKLIIALIIWYIGKYLLGITLSLIKKIELKEADEDEKAISRLAGIVDVGGRIVLVLVILDYLGIGRDLIEALTQAVTLAIAITFGVSFGNAMQEDAKKILHSLKVLFRS